jgi:hypothetical protein
MKPFRGTFSYPRRIYHNLLKRSLPVSIFFRFCWRRPFFIALCAQFVLWPSIIVLAEKPFFRKSIELGPRSQSVRLSVQKRESEVRLVVGQNSATLPISDVKEVSVETVKTAALGKVAVVRVRANKSEAAALVVRGKGGKTRFPWMGRIDARGDPGERHGSLIEISNANRDGVSEIVTGHFREGARICGQRRTVLFPQTVDSESRVFSAVFIDRFSSYADATSDSIQTINATRKSPGPNGPPLLNTLRFTDASSSQEIQDTSNASPPSALFDGNRSTSWTEGRGSGGRGEFAVARWGASKWPIRAMTFVFSVPDPNKARLTAHPKKFWLVGDDQQRIRVDVLEDPVDHPGERYWIVPPKPLNWQCLSIVLEEAYFPRDNAAAHASIAEVEAYTELDFGDGITLLVKTLVQDTNDSASAADLLANIGPASVSPLVEAWKRMSCSARRRAVRVFAASATRAKSARKALVLAVRDKDKEVSEDALKALTRIGPLAFNELSSLISQPSDPADRVAVAIAKSNPAEAIPVLLDIMKQSESTRQPRLREALALSAKKAGKQGLDKIAEWLDGDHAIESLASVVLALSNVPDARLLAADRLGTLIQKARTFKDVWRLVRASKSLPPDTAVEKWLVDIARGDKRWMLRKAALEALDERGAADIIRYANAALKDEYPRVRVAGLSILQRRSKPYKVLYERAQTDPWPMVRAAALGGLVNDPNGKSVLIRAIEDPAKIVRATAIRTLLARADRLAWPSIERRLLDDNEWPRVNAEAIAFVKELCIVEAETALMKILERGLQPRAWLPDVELAASALDALIALKGKEKSQSLIESALVPFAPASIQAVAKQAERYGQPCKSK